MTETVLAASVRSRSELDSSSHFRSLVDGRWIEWVIIATVAMVFYAVPLLSLRLVTDWYPLSQGLVSLPVAVVFSFLAVKFSRPCVRGIGSVRDHLSGIPLWVILVAGLLLRAAWTVLFPAEPGSDSATYWGLAARLAAGGDYHTANTFAFWPVGYPLFLSAWFSLLGASKLALLAANCFMYVLTFFGIAHLTRIIGGDRAAKLAVSLFAIWPNMIASSGTPEKEMLVVALLPWIAALVLQGVYHNRGMFQFAIAGMLMGAAIAIQPSLQFLPIAFAVLIAGLITGKMRGLVGILVFAIAIAAILTPWIVRNHSVFGSFVLVSTNGGDVLYRANNPLATGGYTKVGEVNLSALGELERDRRGRELAIEWIKQNPVAFAVLAFEKQVRFTGDDAAGVYVTFKVGGASDSVVGYTLLKAVANGYWILLWFVLGALCLHRMRTAKPLPFMARVPFWLWLYLFAIHSVFESAGKYHMPVAWVLCSLIAVYAETLDRNVVRWEAHTRSSLNTGL